MKVSLGLSTPIYLSFCCLYEVEFLVGNKCMSATEILQYFPYYEKKHRPKSIYSFAYYTY